MGGDREHGLCDDVAGNQRHQRRLERICTRVDEDHRKRQPEDGEHVATWRFAPSAMEREIQIGTQAEAEGEDRRQPNELSKRGLSGPRDVAERANAQLRKSREREREGQHGQGRPEPCRQTTEANRRGHHGNRENESEVVAQCLGYIVRNRPDERRGCERKKEHVVHDDDERERPHCRAVPLHKLLTCGSLEHVAERGAANHVGNREGEKPPPAELSQQYDRQVHADAPGPTARAEQTPTER